MTKPPANGPMRTTRPQTPPKHAANGAKATQATDLPPRVELDNYKTSYLQM